MSPTPTRRSAKSARRSSSFVIRHSPFRIGLGFDAHEFARGRPLMLGGFHVPSEQGLAGHSDADVLLHALTDALLGALALPDIGTLFPDTDPKWKDAASEVMLREAYRQVKAMGYRLINADCVLVCDRPKLSPHSVPIRESIARMLNVPGSSVGLKAKTTEGTLLALKRKSIAAMAIVLVAQEPGTRSRLRSPTPDPRPPTSARP